MPLSFKNDLEEILLLASRAASVFVRIARNPRLFEDSRQTAILYLLEENFDSSFQLAQRRAYLVKRVSMRLLRDYQKETGARLKIPPRFVNLSGETQEKPPSLSFRGYETEMENLEVLETCRVAFADLSERDKRIINQWKRGERQRVIAVEVGLTQPRISQIIGDFKNRCKNAIYLK